jgi:hypothetical protein
MKGREGGREKKHLLLGYVSAAMNNQAMLKELLEVVFPKDCSCVELDLNTSIVAP